MTQARYDAIVVGGGHNGLIAAGYLAKERLKVLVLERRPFVGEILRTTPPMFPPRGIRELLEFGKLGRKMLKLGDRRLKLFLELMTASCADYLSKRFESDRVMAAQSINGLIGTCVG